jgi:hypothetical protein
MRGEMKCALIMIVEEINVLSLTRTGKIGERKAVAVGVMI